jgi:predicted RNA-binding protein with RPS1 domain
MYVNISVDDYYDQQILTQGISDWEEISEEDFQFVQQNLHLLQKINNNVHQYVLVREPEGGALQAIKSIRDEVERAAKAEQERKAEAKRRSQAAAQKKADKARNKELEQLKKLKEKYSDVEV